MNDKIENLYEECGCLGATLIMMLVVILVLGLVFGIYCLQGWIFMLLWNWLAVSLFGATALSYWVCVGIVFALQFIGGLLFGKRSSVKVKAD